jgi:hypothetical protein
VDIDEPDFDGRGGDLPHLRIEEARLPFNLPAELSHRADEEGVNTDQFRGGDPGLLVFHGLDVVSLEDQKLA